MQKKCRYCAGVFDGNAASECCCAECEKKYRSFSQYYKKYKTLFYCLIGVILALILVPVFYRPAQICAPIALVLMGLTLFVFPFGTIGNNRKKGIKKTVFQVRALAVVALALGIGFGIYMLVRML